MPAASMLRAYSWHSAENWFAGTKHRHELKRLLLDVRAETRWASGRRWIVADAPGSPADALDIELAQFPDDEARMHREVAGSAQLIGRRRTVLVRLMPVQLDGYATTTLLRDFELYVGYAAAQLDWSGG